MLQTSKIFNLKNTQPHAYYRRIFNQTNWKQAQQLTQPQLKGWNGGKLKPHWAFGWRQVSQPEWDNTIIKIKY